MCGTGVFHWEGTVWHTEIRRHIFGMTGWLAEIISGGSVRARGGGVRG